MSHIFTTNKSTIKKIILVIAPLLMANFNSLYVYLSSIYFLPLYEPSGLQFISILFFTLPLSFIAVAGLKYTKSGFSISSKKMWVLFIFTWLLSLAPLVMHEAMILLGNISSKVQFIFDQAANSLASFLLVLLNIYIVKMLWNEK